MILNKKDQLAQERYKQLVQRIFDSTAINPLETKEEYNAIIRRAKLDYGFFVKTFFPHYATAECAKFHIKIANAIRKNKRCKYLLGWGRGLAKSTHLDILIPLWLWINEDLKVMLLIGQNQDKANVLLSDVQAEFEGNQQIIHYFGAQRTIGNWEEGKFITKNDCAFFALGMGQSPRGLRHRQYRPDYIVADDLDTKEVCKNPKRLREAVAWICEDLLGTMDERGSRFIMVNNIFAPATILTLIRDTKKGFEFNQQDATDSNLNPNWPEKNSKAFYQSQLDAMGTLSFHAEYNNRPYTEGVIFTEAMIIWKPIPRSFDSMIGFWDVAYSEAKTADYNAVKLWGVKDGTYYQIKAFCRQSKMNVPIEWVNEFCLDMPSHWAPNWYYESQFWNDALEMVMQGVNENYDAPINFIKSEKPKGAKLDRMMNMLPYYQQGKIINNIEERNNADMQTGMAQLFGIEPGYKGHDDSPDADAQAIEKLSKRTRKQNSSYRSGARESRQF